MTAACPECATTVHQSVVVFPLKSAPKERLRQLLTSTAMVYYGLGLALLIPLVFIILIALFGSMWSLAALPLLAVVASLAGIIVAFIGLLRFTQRDPQRLCTGTPEKARVITHITLLVVLALTFVQLVVVAVGSAYGGGSVGVATIVLVGQCTSLLTFLASALVIFCSMVYSSWFARRVPDAALVRAAKRNAWLVPILLVAPGFMLAGLAMTSVFRGGFGLGLVGLGSIVAVVCYLAGFALYTRVFWRMHKHLQQLVRQGSSLPPESALQETTPSTHEAHSQPPA
jgi:hypothetical protein